MNELSTPTCLHFGACSGCVLSQTIHSPPIWEDVRKYFSCPVGLEIGLLHGWRTKAKLAIRGTSQAPEIGLYKAGTHVVQKIPHCKAHHPSINRAVLLLKEAIRAENISIYNEVSGLLRYAQFFVDLAGGRVQLVLVVQKEDASLNRLVKRLCRMSEWHSIWLNVQNVQTNRILGDRWILVAGDRYLSQSLAGKPFLFHPAAFAQAHWTLYEKLALYVVEKIPEGSQLVELYAGIGVMGILAAPRCQSVQLVENNPFSYESFQASDYPENVTYHLRDAGQSIPEADCVLVDPPRKGLDASLLQVLQKREGRLIYVSCDFGSFVRDADKLQERGWQITGGRGYLLFPGTNHVEVVAIMDKIRDKVC